MNDEKHGRYERTAYVGCQTLLGYFNKDTVEQNPLRYKSS